MDNLFGSTTPLEEFLFSVFIIVFGLSFILTQFFIVAAFFQTIFAIIQKLPLRGLIVFWICFLPIGIFGLATSYWVFNQALFLFSPLLTIVFLLRYKIDKNRCVGRFQKHQH